MVHHKTKLIDILTNNYYCVYNIKWVIIVVNCISYVYLPEVDPGMDATDLLRHTSLNFNCTSLSSTNALMCSDPNHQCKAV